MSKTTKKGFTYSELMKQKPEKELGDFRAVSGAVLSNLRIIAHLEPHLDPSYQPWVSITYSAQVSFENKGKDRTKEQPRAKIIFEYTDQNNLDDIFVDLSAHEEDIEGVFEAAITPKPILGWENLHSRAPWKYRRDVMRCILALEERVEAEKVIAKANEFEKEYDERVDD